MRRRCAADDGPRGQYLPAPGAMCGPGGGGGASNSTDWQGTRAYALGGYHVGLRYDAAETAEVLDRLFAGARVNDRRVPDNYSIALGGTPTTKGAGASRSLKLLVHGSTQLVRSRSGGRVLNALLQYLSADLDPADPSLTRVNATAVLRDGDALLLPPGLARVREAAAAASGQARAVPGRRAARAARPLDPRARGARADGAARRRGRRRARRRREARERAAVGATRAATRCARGSSPAAPSRSVR